MNKDTKRLVNNIEFDSFPPKRVRYNVTCLLDLPTEIFLLICRYLLPTHVLYAFYTPERSYLRSHRVTCDYYKRIKFDQITNNEFNYLLSLFHNPKTPLRPELLILSNKNVSNLIQRFLTDINMNIIHSIFINLKSLTLINCISRDFDILNQVFFNMKLIEYLHITVYRDEEDDDDQLDVKEKCDSTILHLLFDRQLCCLHDAIIDVPDGLTLYKILVPHQSLKNINLVLETIDDLYVLLDGLVPNVEKVIIHLRRSRILFRPRPRNFTLCSQLTEFTLVEPGIQFVLDNIKSILGYMTNLIKLTLSIRDTLDPQFCDGIKFESILNEYLPNLRYFDYTMTHRIVDETLIEDFTQWPMNSVVYENENHNWIHIYSFPWPSSKDDQRKLPVINNGFNRSVKSDVEQINHTEDIMITTTNEFLDLKTRFHRVCQIRTCLPIDIELPLRIYKVILTNQTLIFSMNTVVQPFVRHLIVKRRLTNERELLILARQFPNVEYLKLLFPLEKLLSIRCFQTLFSVDECINPHRFLWHRLINISMKSFDNEIFDTDNITRWFMRNTDLKFIKSRFYWSYFNSIFSIWL